MAADDQSIGEYVGGAASVLLLAPEDCQGENAACVDLLTRRRPAETNLLVVTPEVTPDEWVSVWQHEAGETFPSQTRVVDSGSGVSPTSGAAGSDALPAVSVEHLPEESDLMDLGLAVARRLGEWDESGGHTALCLYSLSALLDAFGTEAVLSLVNGLNDHCDRLGVCAHHHLDPDAHDEETLVSLRPLYDAVVEHAPDGGWIVTKSDTAAADPSFRTTTAPPGGVAKTDPERPETVPIPHSFDDVLELINEPRRRTLLYHLKDCEDDTIDLDSLVEQVYDREQAIPVRDPPGSRDRLASSLVHTHLPRLSDAGILSYDTDEKVVYYDANPALESCIRYVETLELG